MKDKMKTIKQIAQWVIDNRYPKSKYDKVLDSEMYYALIKFFEQILREELIKYNAYLYEHNYTDTDIWAEEPNPADEYLKQRKP